MKQTNNAIKFLMAQYRAIFKNAYFKGIASAVLLTAGLAVAGNAQATALNFTGTADELTKLGTAGSEITAENDNASSGDSGKYNNFTLKASGDITWNADVTIKGGAGGYSNNHILAASSYSNDFKITGTGSLTIDGDSNAAASETGVNIAHYQDNKTVDISLRAINVLAGTLNALDKENNKSGAVAIAADTINIGEYGIDETNGATAILNLTATGTKGITLGRANTNGLVDSTINVNDGGVLLTSTAAAADTVTIKGATLHVGAQGLVATTGTAGTTTISSTRTLIETDGGLVVGVPTSITSHETTINGNLLVSSGNLTVNPAAKDTNDDDVLEAGTLTIGNGANVQIGNGSIQLTYNAASNAHNGKLIIDNSVSLVASVNGSGDSGSIHVTGSNNITTDATSYTNEGPSLTISSATLQSFLNNDGETKYNALTYTEANNTLTTEADTLTPAAKGAILLQSGGVLNFSDTERVTLNDFYFSSGDTIGATGAGTITIGTKGGIVKGHDLAVIDKLRKSSATGSSGEIDPNTKLYLEADQLTLGNAEYSGSASLGFAAARVKDNLTLVGKDGKFTLADKVLLNRDFFVKQTDANGKPTTINTTTLNTPAGVIDGDNIIIGDATSGSLSVEGGAWTSDSSINITKGELSVGAADATSVTMGDPYHNNGNPASLTLIGTITLNGSANTTDAQINVNGASGAEATLDLTQANLEFDNGKSGAITVSGDAIEVDQFNALTQEAQDYYAEHNVNGMVGYGKLLLNREDFSDFFKDGTHTTFVIGKHGYVNVNGSLTEALDFDDFTSGTGTSGALSFNGPGSILEINGDLAIVEDKDASTSSTFAIGEGSIWADRITLNTEKSDNKGVISPITVSGGTLQVSNGFSTNTSSLTFNGTDSDSALVLNSDELQGTGSITMGSNGKLTITGDNDTEGALKVVQGSWDASQIDLDVSGASGSVAVGFNTTQAQIDEARALSTEDSTVYVARLDADNFKASAGATLSVGKQSEATFKTMQLGADSTATVEGHVLVNGTEAVLTKEDPVYNVNRDNKTNVSTTAGVEFDKSAKVTVDGLGAQFEFGAVATNALVTKTDTDDKDKNKTQWIVNDDALTKGNFVLNNFGELKLNLAAGNKLSANDAKYLVDFFVKGGDNTGYVNIGDADIDVNFTKDANGNLTVAWDNVADFAQITAGGATSNNLKNALITGIKQDSQRPIQGHYGAVQVDVGNNTGLRVDGPMTLNNAITAADGNSYFVFKGNYLTGTPTAVDVSLANGANFGLFGGGIVGAIKGSGQYNDDLLNNVSIAANDDAITEVRGGISQVNNLTISGITQVDGNVSAEYLDLTSNLSTLTQGNSVNVNAADIHTGASINTSVFEIGEATTSGVEGDVILMGELTAQNSIVVNGDSVLAIYGGRATTTDLTIEPNGTKRGEVYVGYDNERAQNIDDPDTIFNDAQSYTGYLEVTGTTKFNGGSLMVDPEYGDYTAMASLNDLANAPINDPSLAGTLDGDIFVGQNAALGIGSDSLDTLRSKVAQFQSNGISLNPDHVGSMVYLGKSFTLGAGNAFVLTANSIEGFVEDYNNRDGVEAAVLNQDNLEAVFQDTVYLGDQTLVMIDANVMSNANVNGKNQAVITITGSGANNGGKVIADGGDIAVDGDVRASTYQVFSAGTTIQYIDGKTYAAVDDSEAAYYDQNINVSTENDFLQGVVQADGTVTLGVNPNGRAIMHGASDPVYESLVAYARGYNGPEYKPAAEETPSEEDPAVDTKATTDVPSTTPVTDNGIQGVEDSRELYSYDKQGEKVYGRYSNYFLQETISTGDGSAAEAVARLAVYGGAAQAAISAGASTYDAVSGRMGVGANGANITVADNTQGAALWLAPIYKSSDSDGFDAEGLDYGVDMDLYGVALGADYTLSNGIRFGAMFNVGSGDVDGQGAGSAVSNDFDYYGFAVYGGYSMGALSVVADVSYTVADNDLEGNTSIDKVGASLDSTNLSVGVTGQYQLDFNGTTVTPHAGLRFSRIDLDDYTIDGEDVIADYDADSMNIFSIPVGVTFAKEFTGDAWTVKPSLDLTLTGNFGDDETDGTVHWAGVDNLSTNVSSEVLDNFTYGATLGVAAKTGNFSLGLGVNYTGSSNVDEFGVQANARFVF